MKLSRTTFYALLLPTLWAAALARLPAPCGARIVRASCSCSCSS